jgi:signal transduction histidine kinase
MTGLKGENASRDNLLPAIQRFTAKFAEATKLDLRVNAVGDLRINDRLAAEIFQMVAEGLSNIRRHTMARRASLTLEVRGDHFCLEIENDGWAGASPVPFSPRSLTERAHSLGGQIDVSRRADGGATLKIKIPL